MIYGTALEPPSKPVLSFHALCGAEDGRCLSYRAFLSLSHFSPGLPHLFGQTPFSIQLSSSFCPLYIRLFRTPSHTVAQNQIILPYSHSPKGFQARCARRSRGATARNSHPPLCMPGAMCGTSLHAVIGATAHESLCGREHAFCMSPALLSGFPRKALALQEYTEYQSVRTWFGMVGKPRDSFL